MWVFSSASIDYLFDWHVARLRLTFHLLLMDAVERGATVDRALDVVGGRARARVGGGMVGGGGVKIWRQTFTYMFVTQKILDTKNAVHQYRTYQIHYVIYLEFKGKYLRTHSNQDVTLDFRRSFTITRTKYHSITSHSTFNTIPPRGKSVIALPLSIAFTYCTSCPRPHYLTPKRSASAIETPSTPLTFAPVTPQV